MSGAYYSHPKEPLADKSGKNSDMLIAPINNSHKIRTMFCNSILSAAFRR